MKPARVTFEQAAVVPTAGYIAVSNLRGAGSLAGRNVLINGAGGCVGTLAIQIAKAEGASVTAVDCAEKLPMMRSLGAEHVIDYEKENFLHNGKRYDLIMDVASTLWVDVCANSLTPKGTYTPIGHAHFGKATGRMGGRILGSMPALAGLMLRAMADPEKRKNFRIMPKPEAMEALAKLLESGQLTPVVSRTFPLTEIATAMRCLEEETRVPGRIVVTP